MSEPLSYQLLEAIQQRLQIIEPPSFRSTLGADVRIEGYALEELAGEISLRAYVYTNDLSRDIQNSGPRTKKDTTTVIVDCIVPGPPTEAQRSAHRVLADVALALGTGSREWLPQGVSAFEIQGQEIESRPASLRLIIVRLTLTALLTESLTPP